MSGPALGPGEPDGPGDFLAHHRAHAAADETEVHHAEYHRRAGNRAPAINERVLPALLLLRFFQLLRVVRELQRVVRCQVGVQLIEPALVQQDLDVLVRGDAEVIAASGADKQAGLEGLAVEDFAAAGAAEPHPVRRLGPTDRPRRRRHEPSIETAAGESSNRQARAAAASRRESPLALPAIDNGPIPC